MTQEYISEYLKTFCLGRKNAQTSGYIESAFMMKGSDLRKIVNRLRKKGVPICSGKNGYFYGETAGEVYATIRELKKMRAGLDESISGLENALDGFGKAGDAG